MEIALTDDQEFFRRHHEEVPGAANARSRPCGGLRDSETGFDRDYWRQGAELGWTSLVVPEDLGGGSVSGNGARRPRPGRRCLRRHVAPGPLLPCNVVALALVPLRPREQQSEVLPAIVAGDVVATWAITEPPPHDGLGALALRAEADGADFVLTGVKSPVEAGAEADQLLVTADHRRRPAQFLVAGTTPGVTVTPLRSVDLRAALHAHRVRRRAACPRAPRSASSGTRPPTSSTSCRWPVSCSARRWSAPPRPCSTSPSTGRSAATRSVVRWLVPGDQAPLRRHEDVARGEPRARRRRRPPRGHRDDAQAAGAERRRRRTPATTWPSSSRTACRCTAASASPTSTTSTCSCAGSSSTGSRTAPPPITASESPPSAHAA